MINTRIRVLLSVLRLHSTYGRCTVRAVAADVGRGVMTTHHHLRALRDDGLVDWDDQSRGTLRPLVTYADGWAA